jgi:hypothetical protein
VAVRDDHSEIVVLGFLIFACGHCEIAFVFPSWVYFCS